MTAKDKIIKILKSKFTPHKIEIIDDSALHATHRGALNSKGGHYRVTIVSDEFAGKNSLERHKVVYETLKGEIGKSIHAISIRAFTVSENKLRT